MSEGDASPNEPYKDSELELSDFIQKQRRDNSEGDTSPNEPYEERELLSATEKYVREIEKFSQGINRPNKYNTQSLYFQVQFEFG